MALTGPRLSGTHRVIAKATADAEHVPMQSVQDEQPERATVGATVGQARAAQRAKDSTIGALRSRIACLEAGSGAVGPVDVPGTSSQPGNGSVSPRDSPRATSDLLSPRCAADVLHLIRILEARVELLEGPHLDDLNLMDRVTSVEMNLEVVTERLERVEALFEKDALQVWFEEKPGRLMQPMATTAMAVDADGAAGVAHVSGAGALGALLTRTPEAEEAHGESPEGLREGPLAPGPDLDSGPDPARSLFGEPCSAEPPVAPVTGVGARPPRTRAWRRHRAERLADVGGGDGPGGETNSSGSQIGDVASDAGPHVVPTPALRFTADGEAWPWSSPALDPFRDSQEELDLAALGWAQLDGTIQCQVCLVFNAQEEDCCVCCQEKLCKSMAGRRVLTKSQVQHKEVEDSIRRGKVLYWLA